jgi:hypothetical protein
VGGEQSWPNVRYNPGVHLEALRKAIKISVTVVTEIVLARILTRHLLNVSQYHVSKLAQFLHHVVFQNCNGFFVKFIIQRYQK